MMLQTKEIKIFFKIWLELLAFVNDRYDLIKNFGHPKTAVGLNLENVGKIKTKLWEDVGIIDEYIDSAWDLPREEIHILKGWKNKIKGDFFIVRHLKKYSVFMNDGEDRLYGVLGISCPISDMISSNVLPVMVKAVLLPFKNQIIYDGLLSIYNIQIGPNIRKNMGKTYTEIKGKKGIINNLIASSQL